MKVKVIYPKISLSISNTLAITSGCKNCSFDYVSTLLKKYMHSYANTKYSVEYSIKANTKIIVGDLFGILEKWNLIFPPSGVVLWLDTAWIKSDMPLPDNAKKQFVITTSQWNADILTKMGISNAIVPRAIDDEYAIKYFDSVGVSPIERKYDFMMLATGSHDGHKNEALAIKVLKELGELEKSFLICDLPQCNAKPFSLTDDQKFMLMSQSKVFIWLSESEGFGLPPTEAMSVGTPVIHFDSIYVNTPMNGALSFSIPVYGFKLRESPTVKKKYFPSPVYYYDDVVNTFKEALSLSAELNGEDRLQLHNHVMSNFSHKIIVPKLKKYMGD